ncbi:MAG: hypothetical protein GX967_02510 [Clostridiales bacterium]|nr:hypothetical protein [Clostridiales bacterium]
MKKLLSIFLILLLHMALPLTAGADQYNDGINIEDIEGMDELRETMPEQARDYLSDNSISAEDSSGLMSLSPNKLISDIFTMAKDRITLPIRLLASLIGVVILCSLLESMQDTVPKSSLSNTFGIVGVVASSTILTVQIGDCIFQATQTLHDGSDFMLLYVPIFSSILAVGGNITSATVYNTILFGAAQMISQMTSTIFVPMIGSFLALSIVGSIMPELNLISLANAIKGITMWGLGIIMTIFVGLLTVQSFVGTATDTLALKATKFAISAFVPVVGGALSEALNTVQGSMGILKASIGGFGIIAGAMTMLPTIIYVVMIKGAIAVAGIVSDIFGTTKLSSLFKSCSATLSIIIALLVSTTLLLIISTTIMLMTGQTAT